jgi:heavy metal translocating P-type ATPase
VDEGHSSVDESLVSGESLPIEKSIGSEIVGGSINHTGSLLIQVTRVGENSFLQQVAHQVEEARALKPSILVLVDRVLQVFVPAVLACAVTAAVIWTIVPVVFGGSADGARAVFATLAVLVMGYPCALGMATPLALINGGGVAAKRGILMRSGEAFQTLKEIDYVVFDKTGTLTEGKPEVTAIQAFGPYSEQDILSFAGAIEQQSEHPLARAVVSAANARQIELMTPVTDFKASPGGGVSGIIDAKTVVLGNSRFLRQHEIEVAGIEQPISRMQGEGHTVIILAIDGKPDGLIAIADRIKPDAQQTIKRLQQAGLETMMITGDNQRSAQAVAHRLGIDRFYAEVLPRDKANTLRDLQSEGRHVLFVGDGINDSPALMQADVGMAIGAGTDIAIESADVVLLGERLAAVLDSYYIGRASYRKTVQNLCLAFSFNGIGVPLAVTGLVHPVWAMIAMAASVSTVLINSFTGRLVPNSQLYQATSRLTARVPSMYCSSCLNTIERSLQSIPGIVTVNGDPDTKYLDVAYQADVLDPEKIADSLAKQAFELQQIKIEPIDSGEPRL